MSTEPQHTQARLSREEQKRRIEQKANCMATLSMEHDRGPYPRQKPDESVLEYHQRLKRYNDELNMRYLQCLKQLESNQVSRETHVSIHPKEWQSCYD